MAKKELGGGGGIESFYPQDSKQAKRRVYCKILGVANFEAQAGLSLTPKHKVSPSLMSGTCDTHPVQPMGPCHHFHGPGRHADHIPRAEGQRPRTV